MFCHGNNLESARTKLRRQEQHMQIFNCKKKKNLQTTKNNSKVQARKFPYEPE